MTSNKVFFSKKGGEMGSPYGSATLKTARSRARGSGENWASESRWLWVTTLGWFSLSSAESHCSGSGSIKRAYGFWRLATQLENAPATTLEHNGYGLHNSFLFNKGCRAYIHTMFAYVYGIQRLYPVKDRL